MGTGDIPRMGTRAPFVYHLALLCKTGQKTGPALKKGSKLRILKWYYDRKVTLPFLFILRNYIRIWLEFQDFSSGTLKKSYTIQEE